MQPSTNCMRRICQRQEANYSENALSGGLVVARSAYFRVRYAAQYNTPSAHKIGPLLPVLSTVISLFCHSRPLVYAYAKTGIPNNCPFTSQINKIDDILYGTTEACRPQENDAGCHCCNVSSACRWGYARSRYGRDCIYLLPAGERLARAWKRTMLCCIRN